MLQEMPVTGEEDRAANARSKVADLEQTQEDLLCKQKAVEQEIARLEAQASLLENFSTNLISAGGDGSTAALAAENTVGQCTYSVLIPLLISDVILSKVECWSS